MNFYLLFIVLLYVGRCNSRVVPLSFKLDKSEHVDSSITANELIDESPMDEVEILGHNLPDIRQSKDFELPISEKNKATLPDIPNRNASDLSENLTPMKNAMNEKSDLESGETSAISDTWEEKLNSASEFISQNNSDSRDSFERIQVNGTPNDKNEDLILEKERSIISNSSLDQEQRNDLDFVTIEKALNDTLDQRETFEFVNSDQNETFASFQVDNRDQNETVASFQVDNSDQNETVASIQVDNSDQNETFASFQVDNSDQNETFASFEAHSDQNETSGIFEIVNGTNSTNDFFELQPLSNDTKVEVFLSDAVNTTEILESHNLEINDSVKSSGVIFSGFEFLINSEVARNAAKAMEVFNFSDPLTDHIMEENEFHSFLPTFNAEQDLDSPNQMDLKTTIITNSSGESNKVLADLNLSLHSGDKISVDLNQAEPDKTDKHSLMPLNLSKPMEEGNKTEIFNLEETLKGNVSEVSSTLKNSEEKNELASEATSSEVNIKGSFTNSSAVGVPECPPPGWCIFWFLSQDACAVNEHCLGSRICCKIGCSKACIEVESLI